MLQCMGPFASPILCILPKRVRGQVFGEQFIGFIIPFHVCCLSHSTFFWFTLSSLVSISREQLTNDYSLGLPQGSYFFCLGAHQVVRPAALGPFFFTHFRILDWFFLAFRFSIIFMDFGELFFIFFAKHSQAS